jgi:tRNA1Val (adenine37-N6)-methyltransferase
MFQANDLTDDAFLGGKLHLWQPKEGYRAATDPVLLAACIDAKPGQSVLDLGCGAGTASLCLGARVAGLGLTGLEVQPDYADLARRNAARNCVMFEVVDGDLGQIPSTLKRGFDHVIANPPYYASDGTPSPNAGRDAALRVETPIAGWMNCGARRLSPGGWLTMIMATDCLPEALAACTGKLGSVAVLPLAARAGQPGLRVILQARKGGRRAFRLLAPFVLHSGDGHDTDRDSYTPVAKAILRDGADLTAVFR